METVFDFEQDEDVRIDAILAVFKSDRDDERKVRDEKQIGTSSSDNVSDIISRLFMTYQFSKMSVIYNFLHRICRDTIFLLPDGEKYNYEAGKCLVSVGEERAKHALLNCLDKQFTNEHHVHLTFVLDVIKMLISDMNYYPKLEPIIKRFIDMPRHPPQAKFSFLRETDSPELFKYFIESSLIGVSFRIVACQYMLVKKLEYEFALTKLKEIMKTGEYDNRADACDIILQFGSDEDAVLATQVLVELGGGKRTTIYTNAQNAHNMNESVEQALEFLLQFRNYTTFDKKIVNDDCVEMTVEEIHAELEAIKSSNLLNLAFIRINYDSGRYSKFNMTLKSILLKLWAYIQNSPSCDELKKRLIEELCDASNKCSTGYVSRMVNTMSGFGDFSLRISYRDQIYASLVQKINERLKKADETIVHSREEKLTIEDVLEDITISAKDRFNQTPTENIAVRNTITNKIENGTAIKRDAFLSFFRHNLGQIVSEIKPEYLKYINETDFELYLREAISRYEGY